jgi:NitT/TauT family transport system ATP-binding protein
VTVTAKVQLIDVSQHFAGEASAQTETVALSSVSLHINENEIVTLVGPSGCGKSTILNIIAGFVAPTSGQVLLDGRPLTGIGPQRLVVFQSPALFPWLTVRQNVTFGPRMRGASPSEYRDLAAKIIEDVGLHKFAEHYPYQLSGGMRQRAQIARALVNKPEVLLLDEPFGALDAQTRLEMQEMLLGIWAAYRATILFITHDVEEALFLSDRTYVLSAHPGRIQCEIKIPFGRPRAYELLGDEEFARLKADIISRLHDKPDVTPHVVHRSETRQTGAVASRKTA